MSVSNNTSASMSGRNISLASNGTPAIKIWACIGAVLLCGELYVLFQWITGPNFVTVPSGPDLPPLWMRIVFRTTEVVSTIGLFIGVYWFIFKPWFRDRRVSVDGLLFTALVLAAPWDNLSNYSQYWFTYNSYLVNFGSPMSELPGSLAYRVPGVSDAFPVLAIPFVYSACYIWIAMFACWVMRKAKLRWPNITTAGLVGVCLLTTAVFDLVLEAYLYMPLGFWTYAGGHWSINAGHYYQYPIHEMIMAAIMDTGFCCLRYFVNDKGETLVERGLDQVKGSNTYKTSLRFLAMIGGVHVIMVALYHLPVGAIIAPNSAEWIEDSVSRSYFANQICGERVNRACPGPEVPNHRPDAPYLDYQGNWVLPKQSERNNDK